MRVTASGPHVPRWVEHPDAEKKRRWAGRFSPKGLSDLLLRLYDDYKVPLYVTENGAAYDDPEHPGDEVHDEKRTRYYQRHLEAVQNALAQGADVRGYFAWSLLDNFEWAFGYEKRFGIVHVNFETQKRTLKDSAKWYRDFVEEQRRERVA